MRTGIVFDFDDTLVVSRADRANLLLDALESFGASVVPEALGRLWGRPFEELVVGVAPDVAQKYQQFLTHYAQVLASHPPSACPGVVETLPQLRQRHHLFVHSASHSLLVRTDLQSLGILPCFDLVCGSDWQPVPKPDPSSLAMMAALLDAHGASLAGGWYVGDSLSDVDIAGATGLGFVAVAYDDDTRVRFLDRGVRPSRVIGSMVELVAVVSDRPSPSG